MKIRFIPQDIEVEIEPSVSILETVHKNKIPIKSSCNGLPSCAECRVKIVEGEHNVLPPTAKELSLIGTGYFIDQRRLACQLYCYGDVTLDMAEQVELTKDADIRRPQGVIRKSDDEESVAVTGNLIQEEAELLDEATQELTQSSAPHKGHGNSLQKTKPRKKRRNHKS